MGPVAEKQSSKAEPREEQSRYYIS